MVMEAVVLSTHFAANGVARLQLRGKKELSRGLQVSSGSRGSAISISVGCSLQKRWLLRATVQGKVQEEVATQDEANQLVDQILFMVKDTDRGAALNKEQQTLVSQLVSRLESMNIPPEPLQTPLIFGDWDVEYCSNPTAPGGYYRSTIGRLALKTEEMIQTLNSPDVVGNSVSFSLFGTVKGRVSLKGKLVPIDKKWIEITFESPDLKLGPFEFRYGSSSTVKIAILYVDERIRLGRGSRGAVFVFKRRSTL